MLCLYMWWHLWEKPQRVVGGQMEGMDEQLYNQIEW